MDNTRKYLAEVIGTFALVSSVCGAALFSAPSAGLMTVAFAIGAIVLAMAYALGPISGGHFNPAVTCGLVAAGRCPTSDAIPYIVAQLIGGIAAAAVFYVILSGAPAGKWNDFVAVSNIYGGAGHFPLFQVALLEVVLTALFLIVIVSVTSKNAAAGFAPIAIGLTLVFHPPRSHPSYKRLGQSGAFDRDDDLSAAGQRSPRFGCSGWRRSSAA